MKKLTPVAVSRSLPQCIQKAAAASLTIMKANYFARENARKILSPINAIPIATPPPCIAIVSQKSWLISWIRKCFLRNLKGQT
jgi:hypothetical protein